MIKEKALTETEGWTVSQAEYHIQVNVTKETVTQGTEKLVATIMSNKKVENGTETDITNPADSSDKMDFVNTYKATGSVQFKARKEFTGGTVGENQFAFKLTQVTAYGEKSPVSTSIL